MLLSIYTFLSLFIEYPRNHLLGLFCEIILFLLFYNTEEILKVILGEHRNHILGEVQCVIYAGYHGA